MRQGGQTPMDITRDIEGPRHLVATLQPINHYDSGDSVFGCNKAGYEQ